MSERSERIFDGVTHVDADLTESVHVKKRSPWRAWVAAAACIALIAGLVTQLPKRGETAQSIVENTGAGPYTLARAVYPAMAPYPNENDYVNQGGEYDGDAIYEAFQAWRADVMKQADQPQGYADGLEDYFQRSIRTFLNGDDGENRLFSPMNAYMALAMLAEITDGTSRGQILDLLGAENVDALRAQAKSVWNANYRDDGVSKSVLANSLWLRNDYEIEPVAKTLAENYYASVYSGEMGTEDYDKLLRDWLNDQTGRLLEGAAAQEHFDARTQAAIASALCYQARWYDEFIPESTFDGVFHGTRGDESVRYLHEEYTMTVFGGAQFTAVGKWLSDDNAMWFILPDEGVAPEDLLLDQEAMAFLLAGRDWTQQEDAFVHLSVPKFDVASQLSLLDGLKALGVTDVCDPDAADFTPLLPTAEGVFLSDASHAVRVAVDEEGVTAAAYTLMAMAGAGASPEEEIDFTVDRPFLFALTGDQGLPLFTGIVNHVD